MKTMLSIISMTAIAGLMQSCNDANGRYVDLNTGKTVELEKDPESGVMINTATNKPVAFYVDTKTNDTINGKTGKVVNGHIRRQSDGVYVYDTDVDIHEEHEGDYSAKRDKEYKVKEGDYKKEVEKDGDITIKDGDKKIKIDGETGKRKVTYDD